MNSDPNKRTPQSFRKELDGYFSTIAGDAAKMDRVHEDREERKMEEKFEREQERKD